MCRQTGGIDRVCALAAIAFALALAPAGQCDLVYIKITNLDQRWQ